MSAGTDAIATAKARVKQIENPSGTKVEGVTKASYSALAKAFIESRGGKGFLIAPKNTVGTGGVQVAKTTDEWGAWLAYFFHHGIATKFMEAHGFYTVPAQWPHEFDINRDPAEDYEQAKEYRNRLHQRIADEQAGRDAASAEFVEESGAMRQRPSSRTKTLVATRAPPGRRSMHTTDAVSP